MELLIHFGIYKTGSSFIQTICVRNRDYLESCGIYFPESKYDEKMFSGEISPGNSSGLTNLLRKRDEYACQKLLRKWKHSAERKKCQKILISDEALIHVFSLRDALLLFQNLIKSVGFVKVDCFAYFRNPVDHCLSTFKHRAKRGTIPDFEKWVMETYETMKVIDAFLKVYKEVDFNWLFNAYKSDGAQLSSVFFKDWLNISIPKYQDFIAVNPSLTLSELKIIQVAKKENGKIIPYLYNSFLKLPKASKANDNILECYYRYIAARELKKYTDVLDVLNSKLPSDDALIIENPDLIEETIDYNTVSLSNQQVLALFSAFKDSISFQSIMLDFLRQIKRKFLLKG